MYITDIMIFILPKKWDDPLQTIIARDHALLLFLPLLLVYLTFSLPEAPQTLEYHVFIGTSIHLVDEVMH